jgi:hypothetical protein
MYSTVLGSHLESLCAEEKDLNKTMYGWSLPRLLQWPGSFDQRRYD